MTPQNGKRTTPPVDLSVAKGLARIAAWLDALRATRDRPALRVPRRPKLKAPRPRWLSSFFATRLAVRAGIPLGDFLRHRLSQQLGLLPVTSTRLPMSFSIDEGGAIASRPADEPRRRAPWLESFLRADGAAALGPDVQLAQANVARLAARVEGQRRRVDEMSSELEAAARATELADPDDQAQARRMGRPWVPLPLGIALQLLAFALLVAETWQLALPCLEAGGVRTGDLLGELRRNPAGIVLGSIFAFGASLSLFVLAQLALRRCLDVLEAQVAAPRRAWHTVAALVASVLAAAVAWSVASIRPAAQRPLDLGYARLSLFLVALAVPIAAAWMIRLARRLQERREAALALARAWDQEHYRTLAELSRRAGALAEEEKQLASLEAERGAALRRLQALQRRAAAAESLAADLGEAEAEDLARLAQAIVASLELDRYEYLRQAASRGVAAQRPKGPAPVHETLDDGGRNLGLAG